MMSAEVPKRDYGILSKGRINIMDSLAKAKTQAPTCTHQTSILTLMKFVVANNDNRQHHK